MKKWERRTAAVLFFVAVGAAVKAADIGFGSFRAPGPGFFPFWLAVLMALTAGVYYFSNRGPDTQAQPLWPRVRLKRPVAAVAVMVVFVQVLDFFGFCTATFFLLTAWLRGVEGRSWRMTGVVAVVGTVSVYVLFVYLLQLPLPHGLLI